MADKALARLVDLVPYISTHQGIEIKKLASVFDVSVKQIESDLMTLFMCGYPFYQPMEVHFEDGVVTIGNADELSMVRKLTKLEIISLLVGLNSLDLEDPDIEKLAIKLSAKLTPSEEYSFNTNLEEYFRAISDNEILHITYLAIDRDEITEREIIPLDIYQSKGQTYLRSFCLLSKANRTFRLDRIVKMERTGRSDSSRVPHEEHSQSGSTKIEVHSNQRYVTEYFAIRSNQIDYFSRDWLVRSVLAFAGALSVKNNEIRSEIARRGQQARALYD